MLLDHRKKDHLNIVKICNKYKERKCGFHEDFCWFRHEKEALVNSDEEMDIGSGSENEEYEPKKSVFHETPRKQKPPLKNNHLN